MAIGTSGSGRQTLTEINVTPLVDVMLVLLIIFMVTAPLIQQGVEVKLPEARAQPVKAEEQKLVLSVKEDRSIWLPEKSPSTMNAVTPLSVNDTGVLLTVNSCPMA